MRKKCGAISTNISFSNFIAESCFAEIRGFLRGKIPLQIKSNILVLTFHCQKGGRTTIALSLLTQLFDCE